MQYRTVKYSERKPDTLLDKFIIDKLGQKRHVYYESKHWLAHVDYWLEEVPESKEQQEEKKTAEEIDKLIDRARFLIQECQNQIQYQRPKLYESCEQFLKDSLGFDAEQSLSSPKKDFVPGVVSFDVAALAALRSSSLTPVEQMVLEDLREMTIDDIELVMTCDAMPEQYDAFLNVRVGYLRLRHGEFRVDFPDCGGEIIFEAEPSGDGSFEDFEREYFLTLAKKKIFAKLFNTEQEVQVSDTRNDEEGYEAGKQKAEIKDWGKMVKDLCDRIDELESENESLKQLLKEKQSEAVEFINYVSNKNWHLANEMGQSSSLMQAYEQFKNQIG